tara:strand:- start:61 stop:324 length:264 start_codon:yes stop_codon:yes gene_type:complete
MGRMATVDMIANAKLEQALIWHLTSNHYPPVSTKFVPVCHKAMYYVADENPNHMLDLPNGNATTAVDIVESLHLWDFVQRLSEGEDV